MKKLRYNLRLTIIMCFFVIISNSLFAQNEITIKNNNITIKEALAEVEKQSHSNLNYNESKLQSNKVINLNLQQSSLDEALNEILKGTGFTFKISGNVVMIVADTTKAKTSAKIIKGRVCDAAGEPLIGVNILIDGRTGGAVTDLDGNFELQVKSNDVLNITYIGYKNMQIKVTEKNFYDIVMKEDTKLLDEVVVTALGIKRKSKALGYNITEVSSDELTAVKDANFVNSLNGKVAGLQINSSASGIGGSTKVVMRGAKSISKSNNVLYVIDGVPLLNSNGGDVEENQGMYTTGNTGEGIANFNPEDIASISVLTGPAAAALYGSNGANGAILITTKKGEAGKAQVTIAHNTDFSTPLRTPKFQNTYGNKSGEFSSWGDKLETPTSYDPKKFFRTGYNTTTSVSISLGNEKNQTYASLATTAAEGIVPNNIFDRHNITVRNTTNFLNDKLTMDLGFSYVKQKDKNMLSQGQYFNPLVPTYLFPRGEDFDACRMYERFDEGRNLMTQYWPYGEMGLSMQNPYWVTNRNIFKYDRDRYMLNAGLNYKIADWIDISGRFRMDNTNTRRTKKLYASTESKLSQSKGYYGDRKVVDKQFYGDLLININKRFNDFDIVGNIGASMQNLSKDEVGAEGQLSLIPNFFTLHNVDLNANNSRIIQDGWEEKTHSLFASMEFGWRSMVYLSLTARNDWASALEYTPTSSFFYPSVGLSGVMSEIFNLPDWVSFWKMRVSYSSVGNAPSRYLTIPSYGFNGQGQFETNSHMPVPELYPERTKSYEIGTNIKLFEGRLGLDLTCYQSSTYNQTFRAKASPSSGYSSFYLQAGNIANRGLEAMINYEDDFGPVRWNSTVTFNMNRNEIKELVRDYPDPVTGELISIPELEVSRFGTYRMILTEGGSMGDLYVTNRLREDASGFIYVDPDSNQLQTVEDLHKVGNADPKFNLGFNNAFNYGNFDFSFLISARVGGEVLSATQAILDRFGVSKASADARDNGGVPVNFGKYDAQAFYEYVGGGESGMLNNYVFSATNVRLQEVRLGYRLPKRWFADKLDVNLSLVGKNLLMLYCKAPNDPESVAFTGTYFQGLDYFMQPSLRNVGFSVRVKF